MTKLTQISIPIIMMLVANSALAQSTIVLRNLELIKGKSIESFDRTAVQLTDGTELSWDEILRANLGNDRQEEFDQHIIEIGLPIFRLKSRIKRGDWTGAGLMAEPIFSDLQLIEKSPFTDDIKYLVNLATMKSRLKSGNRAGAVLPFLRALEIQPHVAPETLELTGENCLPENQSVALLPELLPVWFDIENVAISKEQIASTKSIGPSLGRSIYLASMQIELDQNNPAEALLDQIETSKSKAAKLWSLVLRARMLQRAGEHVQCQSLLDRNATKFTGDLRPVAIYYRALNDLLIQPKSARPNQTSDVQLSKTTLMLLRIPAIYGKQHPELAAAAIFQAAKIAKSRGRHQEAQKLTQQLLQRHSHTYHGTIAALRATRSPAQQ